MGDALQTLVHFVVTWVPAWLGFSGWCFSLILILEGKRGRPEGSGSVQISQSRIPFYLTVALVMGAAVTVVFKLGGGIGRGLVSP